VPVGPVTPLPAELDARQSTIGPVEPVVPGPVSPVATPLLRSEAISPVVPGAEEAGLVVADTSRLFGFDAIPEYGAAVIAASGLQLGARLEIEYDDNEARVPGELPPDSRFDSKDDVVLRPSLSANLGRDVGNQLLFLNARIGRTFHLLNDNLGRENLALDGGVNWRAGPACSGTVEAGWSSRESSIFDFATGVPPGREFTRFLASGSCATGIGLISSVSYDRGWLRFEDEISRQSNTNSWGISGSLGYPLGPRGQVGVQGGYRNSTFINQPLPPIIDPEMPDNGISLVNVAGFFSYQLGVSFAVNGNVGWSQTSSVNPLFQNFSGITGSISLAYSTRRVGAAFSFSRNSNLGATGGAGLRIVTLMTLSGNYRLSDRMSLSGGIGRSARDNRGSPGFGDPFGLVNDRFWLANAGVNYRLTERLGFSLDYTRRDRDPREDIFNPVLGFVSNRISGTLRFTYP
jgi:hypothetical protein